MKKLIAITALLACPSLAMAENYATCLLDALPGVQNQAAITAAIRLCRTEHPGGLTSIEQGAGKGLFASYKSSDECTFEKAKDTRHAGAIQLISHACRRLYNEPIPPDSAYWKQFQSAQKSCENETPGPWCAYR